MTQGLALVRAHFDSFMAGHVDDFQHQLTPKFRYRFLPPVLGEGPAQARRWRDILFSLYRDWGFELESGHEENGLVFARVSFVGLEPASDDLASYFYDATLFEFDVTDSRLAGCNAMYLPFDAHEPASAIRNTA